ncbi:PRC-barrel domain-containing protein [Nitrosomonas marina]|uniref:PRC-barrel domain-containing protein n=1 Tax=Nitrosomonas marina TaxID=917 RepID=A0A1H8E5I0_9PROT|nr:PRC-barrel domain-containing protein [Nitrosomonas marina]SEN14047.1 PRC-barrel domain-containing protein [Nitrosomonas marina]
MIRNFFYNRLNIVVGLALLMYVVSSNTFAGSEIKLGAADYVSDRDMSVKQITGIEVVDEEKKKIGKVNDLLLDKNNAVAYAVVYLGGVFGVEIDKQVAVPFGQQRIIKEPTDSERVFALNVSLPALQQEPEFKPGDANATKYVDTVLASTMTGLDVFGKNDNMLGVIQDFIFNNSHEVVYAIIRTSGVAGISDKLVAAPYHVLTVNEKEKKVILNVTDEALEKAPVFQY